MPKHWTQDILTKHQPLSSTLPRNPLTRLPLPPPTHPPPLQWHGFTCGMDDLLLVPRAEARRKEILTTADAVAVKASADFAAVEVPAEVLAAAAAGKAGGEAALYRQEARVRASLAPRYRCAGRGPSPSAVRLAATLQRVLGSTSGRG